MSVYCANKAWFYQFGIRCGFVCQTNRRVHMKYAYIHTSKLSVVKRTDTHKHQFTGHFKVIVINRHSITQFDKQEWNLGWFFRFVYKTLSLRFEINVLSKLFPIKIALSDSIDYRTTTMIAHIGKNHFSRQNSSKFPKPNEIIMREK